MGRRARVRGGVASAAAVVIAVLLALAAGPLSAFAGTGGAVHVLDDQGPSGTGTSLYEDDTPPTFPPSTSLADAAKWVGAALTVRSDRLEKLAGAISSSKTLTSGARATLSSLVGTDATGIGTLASEVSGAKSLQALEGIAASMIDDYRVFSVVDPVVEVSLSLYDQLASAAYFRGIEAAIEASIATEGPGQSTAAAQALYRDLLGQIGQVTSSDPPAAQAVLALQPSSYPGSGTVVASAKATVASSGTDLAAARQDVQKIVQLLASPGLNSQRRLRLRGFSPHA